MKKICIVSLLITLFLTMGQVNAYTNFTVKRRSLNIYEKFDINEIIDSNSSKLIYTSSNEDIATVTSDGIIFTNKLGQFSITVTDEKGDKYTCEFSSGYYVGIDVSSWNNLVDWKSVKIEGMDFAMIRSSYGWYDDNDKENGMEYEFQYDKQLLNNLKGASENEIPFGIYHYAYATTVEEANLEALYAINAIDIYGGLYKSNMSLPIAYDIEDSKLSTLSKQQITDIIVAFCTKVYDAGYIPMVYANNNWFKNYIDLAKLNALAYNLWYARYVTTPSFDQKITIADTSLSPIMWQYTSTGSVSGATTSSGYTDINVLYMKDRVKITIYDNGQVIDIKGTEKGSKLDLSSIEKEGYNVYFTLKNNQTIDEEFIYNEDTDVYAVFTKKVELLKGDLNGDGIIDSTDAAIVLTKYKNNSAISKDILAGDMNNDKVLDSIDAAIILTIYKNN